MSTASAVLGFPRIGPNREVKKAVESYWGKKSSAEDLLAVAKSVRKGRWETIASKGVDVIPSGDFTLYDHVLDHAAAFNAIPERYTKSGLSALDIAFAMGRGRQEKDQGIDLHAMEMKKWFDSNYHFVVPEISPSVNFKLNNNKFLDEYKEAKELGITTRPVLLGPISFLVLSKAARDAPAGYKPISALDSLLEVYKQVLSQLKEAGVEHVQIDEPILVQDVGETLGAEFKKVYETLASVSPKITLATYFGRIGDSVDFVKSLPIYALHIDLDRAAAQLESVVSAIKSTPIILSLGLVSGRNIWKTDLQAAKKSADYAINELGKDRVVVATSSSLLHTPVTLASEDRLTAEQKSWFSFATEKCEEISTLAKALNGEETEFFKQNTKDIAARREFERNSDPAVRDRLAAVTDKDDQRKAPFPERQAAQKAHLKLPKFPTTTIGSFPQTKEIRLARAKFNKKEISTEEYEKAMKAEIQHAVDFQERIGLDVFVHGEPERNDMVQYFGEQLQGYAFTQNGWVQSYGSRYVRPPILVSDISRPKAMTVEWSSYAQSLSKKNPMKGMLTGPITMLCWSFPRADISRETQAKQLALALRDEVVDLQNAGISIIQVDEPAIREGLPLRKGDWGDYLVWATSSFRLATCGVENGTQIHSHFCYSDFDDIFPSIKALDADVISIEASKADLKLIETFKQYGYTNDIGPGVYDIHSPRVPGVQEIQDRIKSMVEVLPGSTELVINPDCGLKTRGWKETEESLQSLVTAAKWARETYA